MLVRGHDHVRRLQPFALQLQQRDLDHHQARDGVLFVQYGLRQEVARQARGQADAVEAPAAARQRLLHIGPEAVVHAHVAARLAPVAGGQGRAVAVDQGQRGRLAGAVGLLQLAVEGIDFGGRQRVGEGGAQLRVQRQHLGQGAVAVYALAQGLGVEAELALHALASRAGRGGRPAHRPAACRRACRRTAAAGSRRSGVKGVERVGAWWSGPDWAPAWCLPGAGRGWGLP